jgi:hypothetical protein
MTGSSGGRALAAERELDRLINFYEELRVFLSLLTLNLVVLLLRGRLAPIRTFATQTAFVFREALQQMGSNPFLLLFFWLVFAQACGWVGVLLTVGWKALVQVQTGTANP